MGFKQVNTAGCTVNLTSRRISAVPDQTGEGGWGGGGHRQARSIISEVAATS